VFFAALLPALSAPASFAGGSGVAKVFAGIRFHSRLKKEVDG
jgi:hypothetical protein